jgi:hypothetical protein
VCKNTCHVQYWTNFGFYWLCRDCAIIKGHMDVRFTDMKIQDTDRIYEHQCECEHIDHSLEGLGYATK